MGRFPAALASHRARRIGFSMIYGAQPPLDHVGDLVRVLLQHHHVAVAVNADIGEADEGGLHPGLGEVDRPL
jgi:hypothetical protein